MRLPKSKPHTAATDNDENSSGLSWILRQGGWTSSPKCDIEVSLHLTAIELRVT